MMPSQFDKRATHRTSHINSLRLRLYCDDNAAQAVQQRASHLFHQRLQNELGALVQQVLEGDDYASLSVDQLVLEVGEVEFAQFDEQLCERVLQQLGERLQALLTRQPLSHSSESDALDIKLDNKSQAQQMHAMQQQVEQAGGLISEELRAISSRNVALAEDAESALLGFISFLQAGIWTRPVVWQSQSPDAWLQAQLQRASKEWMLSLAFACLQPQAIRRLLSHFDANSLRAVHQVLLHPQTVTLPAVADWTPYLCWTAMQVLQQERVLAQLTASVVPSMALKAPPVQEAPLYWQYQIQNILQESDWPAAWRVAITEYLTPLQARGVQSKQDIQLKQDTQSEQGVQSTYEMQSDQIRQSTQRIQLEYDPQSTQRTQSEQGPQSTQHIINRITQALHRTEKEPFAVSNAGLVLLWPFLPRLLHQLGVLEEQRFISMETQLHTVCCLDWLIWESIQGEHEEPNTPQANAEWRTPFTKLLCGVPVETVIEKWEQPDAVQQKILRNWLSSALQMWEGLQRCAERDMVSLFVQRAGMLAQHRTHWQLDVERDACDVLLSIPPWPISEIRLPWLAQMVKVVWLPNR